MYMQDYMFDIQNWNFKRQTLRDGKNDKDDAPSDWLSEGKSVVHVRALTYCDIHTINVEKLKEVSTNKAKKNQIVVMFFSS